VKDIDRPRPERFHIESPKGLHRFGRIFVKLLEPT
jgi:hypothetical protein